VLLQLGILAANRAAVKGLEVRDGSEEVVLAGAPDNEVGLAQLEVLASLTFAGVG
jgi:hypothetical protein